MNAFDDCKTLLFNAWGFSAFRCAIYTDKILFHVCCKVGNNIVCHNNKGGVLTKLCTENLNVLKRGNCILLKLQYII